MKKYFIPLFVMVLMAVAFSSCKPDEEIYNPTCKISKIWYLSNVGSPNEVYNYDSKGNLEEIVVDSTYSFQFSYNKDKTVSQIVHVGKNYTENIAFQWTDRLVDQMTYTVDGNVVLEYTFHRIDNKKDKAYGRIEHIDVMYDASFYEPYFDDISNRSSKHPLYDMVFGDYEELSKLFASNPTKDLVIYSVKKFTYEPGKHKDYKNLAKYVEEFPISQTVIAHTYTYDTKSYNPFYGLPFAYAEVKGYYYNLPLTEHIETYVYSSLSAVEDITFDYEGVHYMNDKHYPRQFVTRSSATGNIPRNTYILYKK
jgi:hypothetical protein